MPCNCYDNHWGAVIIWYGLLCLHLHLFLTYQYTLVFLQMISSIGTLAYLLDRNGKFRNSFNDSWDRILSRHPMPFYYCLGTWYFSSDITVQFMNKDLIPSLSWLTYHYIVINWRHAKMMGIFSGVVVFFVLIGFFGLILHCSSINNTDPCMAGCRNCCYGWGILDCFPASMEACFALAVIFVIIFTILGIVYGLLAATMAFQRIWQRHYHILTKRELTKAETEHFFFFYEFMFLLHFPC